MRLRAFASGSKGNSLAVRSAGTLVLVDLGISCRQLCDRMKDCGVDPDEVTAIVFTHDHSDHFDGLATFMKKHPDVQLYANGGTADAISRALKTEYDWNVFETAVPFEIGEISIETFSVPHDAADSVGYLFRAEGKTAFVATDFGAVTAPIRNAIAQADCAVLESNHDSQLLARSDRPPTLKQRIACRSGHLSNDDAADLVRTANPTKLRHLMLAHLSHDCNAPHLAEETMKAALADIKRDDITVTVLSQDEPGPLIEF